VGGGTERRRRFLLSRSATHCGRGDAVPSLAAVRWWIWVLLAGMASPVLASARAGAPLHNSVTLNIGINCQWRQACIARQQRAMRRALAYVRTKRPPSWKVHLCNRNAARSRYRVDWVGFDNCIRNTRLKRP
jgi:hypothetical protein